MTTDLPTRAAPWAALALAATLAGCAVVPPRYDAPPPRPAAEVNAPMYFYPEQGQSEERQDRDRYECYRWAVRETGVDPGMTPVREVPRPRAAVRDGGEVVGGAVTGAVVGTMASGPRNLGGHAILGALFGAAIGAAVQESRVQQAERHQAARQDAARAPLNDFRRAMGACMQGRGYRIG